MIINGNHDVGSIEHAVEMYSRIPNYELGVFTGRHGDYLGALETLQNVNWPPFNAVTLIEEFLNK